MEEVAASFHSTLDCQRKEYHYAVCLGKVQLPFYRYFSWHFIHPVDLDKIRKASQALLGRHNFAAFTDEQEKNMIREIFAIAVEPLEFNRLIFRIIGDHFLYGMVRNIVGTLLYIGCGKLSCEELFSILKSKNHKRAGVTAPPYGLVLKKVIYDKTE